MGFMCYFWVGTLGSEHKAGTQHGGGSGKHLRIRVLDDP